MARIEEVEEALFHVVQVLESLDIPYAVMGGFAVRIYALPRATQDVDITIDVPGENLESLRDALAENGCSIPPVYDAGWLDRVAGMPLFKVQRHIGENPIDVDLFVTESAFQESIIARRRFVDLQGKQIALVSPEDLLLLKLAAGRPRDRVDVQDLLMSLGDPDAKYMQHWAAKLGVAKGWREALDEFHRQ